VKDRIQQTNKNRKPKVGVVVGSGGIKAISSIPLYEFLDEAEIDVDLLIGCSGGSIFAGLWAVGNDAPEIRNIARGLWRRELFTKIDYKTLLSIAGLPFGRFDKKSGLVKPDVVQSTYKRVYGDHKLENLRMRTILQSTDVLTGESVMLNSGLLRDAVYASSAMFPVLPPIYFEGRWLMDGACCAPLPILEAVNEGMDVIIGISNEERTPDEPSNFIEYLMRTIGYQTSWLRRNQVALSVDLHHHEIVLINVVFDSKIGLRAVDKIPEILESGQKAVDKKKDEILAAIADFSNKK
jgi:NTE family protein